MCPSASLNYLNVVGGDRTIMIVTLLGSTEFHCDKPHGPTELQTERKIYISSNSVKFDTKCSVLTSFKGSQYIFYESK